jgi:hypothetical protein
MTATHYLLPHERRAAALLERRPDSAAYAQLMKNSGPEGVRLWAATYTNFFPGSVLLIGGVVARLVQPHGMPVACLCLFAAGLLFMALGMTRNIQLALEGRRFRAGRIAAGKSS